MDFIKKIVRTQLFRISSLNSVSVVIKIGIGLITSKVIAIYVGPAGMALVGNMRNFMTSVESFATLGLNGGIIKSVAEHRDNPAKVNTIVATLFMTLSSVAIITSCLLFFFAGYLNEQVFGAGFQYALIFKALAVALPFYSVSIFLLAVINGLGRFRNVIYVNIMGNVIGLLMSVALITQFNTLGALLSIVITPSLLFFLTFYYISREFPFFKVVQQHKFDLSILKSLSSYSLMALFSSVFGAMVFLAIRKNIIAEIGIEAAGYWETMVRISGYYLMFVTTLVTVYFLPKLAVAQQTSETRSVFLSYFKSIIPLFITGAVIIYLLRFFIIKTLFTAEFIAVERLFIWQLAGDVFKVASFILGYQFIAKKLTVAFIATEIMSLSVMFLLSYFLTANFGVEGVVMAHCFTFIIYFGVLAGYFRKSIF